MKCWHTLFGPSGKKPLQSVTDRERITNFKKVIKNCDIELPKTCDRQDTVRQSSLKKVTGIAKCKKNLLKSET